RTSEDSERCYRILRDYVSHAKKLQQVRFVTAEDLLQLYEGPISPAGDRRQIAEHLSRHIVFLETSGGTFSPADMLLQLLHVKAETVDGPTAHGVTTVKSSTIEPALFDRAVQDAAAFIRTNHRLPSEVFIGSETLSLADFAATLAMAELSHASIQVAHGHVEFDQYFATDPKASFNWVIHPEGFAAPE